MTKRWSTTLLFLMVLASLPALALAQPSQPSQPLGDSIFLKKGSARKEPGA